MYKRKFGKYTQNKEVNQMIPNPTAKTNPLKPF